jgi:hypothetical protein
MMMPVHGQKNRVDLQADKCRMELHIQSPFPQYAEYPQVLLADDLSLVQSLRVIHCDSIA